MDSSGIVLTGLGAVTPYGAGVETLWQALLRGDSALSSMDLFDLGGIGCTKAGVIRNVEPPTGFETAPRAQGFAAGACLEALRQAALLDDSAALAETALVAASNFGDIDAGEAALVPPDRPGFASAVGVHCAHAAPAAALAKAFRLGGPCLPLSLSCASGAAAVATAAELIVSGRIRRALVVGYDALSRFSWSGLCSLRTMTKDVVRPFDLNRSGTIFSEGAAALVLERRDACAERGAVPLAVLCGWATGNNGHHMTAPAPRGAGSADVMRRALVRAGLPPETVDHINAHGTGTKPNDSTETEAIQDVFGPRASAIPVTSVKGLMGHLLGAAGSAEIVVSVLTLQRGVIPPTGNLQTPDPECPLDVVTSPRSASPRCVLSNSAGFGGCNAAVVLASAPSASSSIIDPRSPTSGSRSAPSPVFITGLGVVSALGADAGENAAALKEGDSALFPLARFSLGDAAEPPLAGEAPDPDLAACGVAPKAYLDRASQLFLAACGMAFREAGLSAESLDAHHAGVMCGTAWGCVGTAELFFSDYVVKGPRLVKPFLFPHAYSNTAVSLAAMEWGLKGPHENAAAAAAASGVALVEAFDEIRSGRAALIAAGGTDALSATALRARRSAQISAPLGEASAVLVLESAASSQDRRARPVGELLGCGLAATPAGAVHAALTQAGCAADQVAAVYANAAAREAAQTLSPGVRVVSPETLSGDVQGATTALHLVFALLSETDRQGPFLILTAEANLCAAVLISRVAG